MQSQNGDVQLSVTLDTKGIKSDVQKLKNEIQKEVDKKKTNKQDSIINADGAVEEIKKVESEMEKLHQMKEELSSDELSMDTQAELDRIQAILDKKKQAEQTAQEQLATEEKVVENARSAAEIYRESAETQARVQQEIAEIEGASNNVAEAQQQVAEDCSLAVREVERMKTAMANTDELAEDLAYDLNMFNEGNKYSDDFVRLNNIAQDLTKEFNKGADALFRMETLGDTETAEFSELATKTAEIADQLRDVNGLMDDMRKSGEAYSEGVNTAEFKKVERAYDAITNKITLKREAERQAAQEAKEAARQEAQAIREAEKEQTQLAKEAQHTGKTMQQAGNQGTRAMKNTAKETKKLNKEMNQTNKHGKGLRLNFLKILGAAIGIRSLYAVFSKLRSAVTDGIKTLAQWNNGNNKTNESISMLMNSLNQLKSSIGAAFAPILTAVAPALNYLIELLTQATNALAQFFAYISGASTWMRAKKQQDDYAKSLKKTGSAAKDAAGKLAAFDDLDVLNPDKGGGGAGEGAENLFEEVPIDPWFDEFFKKLQDLWKKVQPILQHFWDVLKKGFLDTVGDLKPRFEDILNSIGRIKDALIAIFDNDEMRTALMNFVDSFLYFLGTLAGSVVLIGVAIAQGLLGGIANWLEQDGPNIKERIITLFNVWSQILDQLSLFLQSFSNMIADIMSGDEMKTAIGNILTIFSTVFGDILILASEFALDLITLITQPFIDNAEAITETINGLLSVFNTFTTGVIKYCQDMGRAWKNLYDNHIHPFVMSVKDGISSIIAKFLEFWNDHMQPLIDKIALGLTNLLNEYIKPICEDILEIIGAIIDILKFIWEVVLQPFIEWLIETILPTLTPIFNGIFDLWLALRKTIFAVIELITGLLKTFLGFFRDVFTYGIQTAWINLKTNILNVWKALAIKLIDVFEGLGHGLADIFNGIMGAFEGFINSAIDGVNTLIDMINNLIAQIAKLPSSLGFDVSGIHLDHAGYVFLPRINYNDTGARGRIPALAQGAVIPPNKEFLAMLGDQRYGTNIEAPLDTIKEAFAEVVGNMQVENVGSSEMILDGQTFARLIVPYVVSEMNRRGMNVKVLEAT